jgi:hypothetical protein
VGEVRVVEVRAGELRAAELRAGELRAGEVRAEEPRVGEVRAGEVVVTELSSGEATARLTGWLWEPNGGANGGGFARTGPEAGGKSDDGDQTGMDRDGYLRSWRP